MTQHLRMITMSAAFLISFYAKAQEQNCLDFDGIDDEVVIPAASSMIANSNAITLSMWVYPTNSFPTFPDYDGFAGIRNNTDADFYLVQIETNKVEARFRNSLGINYDILDTTMPLNVWIHYAFVYSGTELTLYRNGVIYKTITASGMITNPSEDLYIGNLIYQGTPFLLTGKMDEVALWSRALNPNEVDCIYHESVNPSDILLKLFYDFNDGHAGSVNGGLNVLTDVSGHIDGVINNFALSGPTSNWISGVNNYLEINDMKCRGQVYVYDGVSYPDPGTFLIRYPVSNVCDSVVSLVLTETDTTVTESGGMLTSNQTGASYAWADCNNGYSLIAGENGRSYIPLVTGTYAAIITNGGCTDTTMCHSIIADGISSVLLSQLKINNPFTSQLKINFADAEVRSVTINDIRGRKVFTTDINGNNSLELNTSDWNAGIYFINVVSSGGTKVVRAIKY
jgi:hypothetical protein